MSRKIDVSKEIGKKYGRYTVLSKAPERGKYGHLTLICQCDCGNIRSVYYRNLKKGTSKSCGCLQKEVFSRWLSENQKKHGDALREGSHHYLYTRWLNIKNRCFNPNNENYKDYGGRGITIYEPWINDYKSFKTWVLENIGEGKDGESIDRINVDENYAPGNLRWANDFIQANNKRNNIKESDIVGKKFGRLEIISSTGRDKNGHKVVLCKCECGKLKKVTYSALQNTSTKSCGCLKKELMQKKILEIKKKSYICILKK